MGCNGQLCMCATIILTIALIATAVVQDDVIMNDSLYILANTTTVPNLFGLLCKLCSFFYSECYVTGHCCITYIIGHCNPSVSIIDLVTHTTYVMCVNLIHKWRDLQFKIDSERQIFFEKLFMPILIIL